MSIIETIRPCKKCGVMFSGVRCKECKKLIPVNKEKAKARYEKWNALNPGVAVSRAATWNSSHPEVRKQLTQNRRAQIRCAGGKLSKGIVSKLFKLQKGKCPCCKQVLGDNYHLDHIIPLYLGGSNTDDNMQLLRQRCNNQKNKKHPIDFMQSRGFLL